MSIDEKETATLGLSIENAERGKATVVASLGDDELHRDKLDLDRAEHRGRFALQ